MKFVPDELKREGSPCRFIPLTEKGETVDYFYGCGSQLDLEAALANWLRAQISRIKDEPAQGSVRRD